MSSYFEFTCANLPTDTEYQLNLGRHHVGECLIYVRAYKERTNRICCGISSNLVLYWLFFYCSNKFIKRSKGMCVITIMPSCVILFSKTVDKCQILLYINLACQFSIHRVILLVGKGRMFWFLILLFGYLDLGIILVSIIVHFDSSIMCRDSTGSVHAFWNWDLPSFLWWCSHLRNSPLFKVKGPLGQLFFSNFWKDGHGQVGCLLNIWCNIILSNNKCWHVEVFDVEVEEKWNCERIVEIMKVYGQCFFPSKYVLHIQWRSTVGSLIEVRGCQVS